MRIDRLELTNFRCFESLTLDLHPKFNVFIGQNGAGKTAVLDALAVALDAWFLGFKSGGSKPRRLRPDDARLVSGRKAGRNSAAKNTFEPQYPVVITARGIAGDPPESVTWERILNGERSSTIGHTWPLVNRATEADRRVRAFEPVTLPVLVYYGAGRLWPPPRTKVEQKLLVQRELSRLEGYREALGASARVADLKRWLEYEDRAAYSEGERSPAYAGVLDAMRLLLPGAAEVRFDAQRLEIVVGFEEGEERPFTQLSDGQRNLLALAGDIAARMARLNPQFGADVLAKTPGVVLIDELDLHLHPAWQREVAGRLRATFPLVQFVSSTHSPQIISELQPEHLTILYREDDGHKARPPQQSYGLDVNEVVDRIMGGRSRAEPVRELIAQTEDALETDDLAEARRRLAALRQMIHGDDSQSIRLDSSITSLEALDGALDS